MLPAAHRLRRSTDFGRTVRKGVRAGRPTMVVHHLANSASDAPAMVGFVVSKAVGNAVERNRVKRRLRGSIAEHLELIPRGSLVVVRALAPAANCDFQDLDRDVAGCLARTNKTLSRVQQVTEPAE